MFVTCVKNKKKKISNHTHTYAKTSKEKLVTGTKRENLTVKHIQN